MPYLLINCHSSTKYKNMASDLAELKLMKEGIANGNAK